MNREELEEKHPLYVDNIDSWNFYRLAYDGGRPFVEEAIVQHPLESNKNYLTRLEEGICFNYSAAIIDLFNFYLTERAPSRHLRGLEKDIQWIMFEKDADLCGTDFDTYLNNTQKISSVYGSAGVLVNKPNSNSQNLADEINNTIYPYCATYTLSTIYDWLFKRNPVTNRPELVYLKLKETEPGRYTIWTKDSWETWELPDEEDSIDPNTGGSARRRSSAFKKDSASRIEAGANVLGEIPFVWMPNIKNIYNPYLGISDIREISYITASIIRNLSHGEEVIKFAGFPMLRVPMEKDGEEGGNSDPVGVRAVQEFPPDNPNAKPDWMETAIAEPIDAVLRWIDRKVDETYRVAHLSGVHGQRKSNNEVSSGLALRYEFQQLNSVLLQKSNNMLETEQNIIRLWLKWQSKEERMNDIEIIRSAHFSIDDLSINLENIIKTMASVQSKTFKIKAQKQLSKVALPDLTDSDFKEIEKEITEAEEAAYGEAKDMNEEDEEDSSSGGEDQ